MISSKSPLNIIFAGTPEFSASILESILAAGHYVSAVYCQPDRRVGRGKKLSFGPVKSLALEKGIAVEQPVKFNQETDEDGLTANEKLANYNADLMIVVAYGLILPETILKMPKFGCVNIHASLLPRWRGAAPIQRAIETGDQQTGITIMQMDKGLDTGNMLTKQPCEIQSTDTGSVLHDRLVEIACKQINQFLADFSAEKGSSYSPGKVQDNELACYAHKLHKQQAEIDWAQSAVDIERKIRAFNSWPVCFTYVGEHRLRVWQAMVINNAEVMDRFGQDFTPPLNPSAAGDIINVDQQGILIKCGGEQLLLLTQLQADGSRMMNVKEMLNSKKHWFIENSKLGKHCE